MSAPPHLYEMHPNPISTQIQLNQHPRDAPSSPQPLSGVSSTDDEVATCYQPLGNTLTLADLPNELFDHVLDYLHSPCPSETNWQRRPDLYITSCKHADLKSLSLVSKTTRALSLARLFAHVSLDPNDSPAFLDFIDQHALSTHVQSIVAHMTEPCRLILHPLWWARLLNWIPAQTFTVICPPPVLADFASTAIDTVDSWAFNMPFHVIRLHQSKRAAIHQTSFNDDHDIFSARPWREFSINEGSCLKVYSQYEYFLRRTPSLMSAMLKAPSPLPGLSVMLNILEKFTYTAIFPFYNHVDDVLKTVRKMRSLKHLCFRLCPVEPSRDIEDEMEDSKGHINLSDAWMEMNTAYSLVAHTARFMSVDYNLLEFKVEDPVMSGSQELFESLDRVLGSRMAHQRDGLWCKVNARKEGDQAD